MSYEEKSANLAKEILDTEYYTNLFLKSLYEHKILLDDVIAHDVPEDDLLEMWNTFWNILPDSPSIRTITFFKLCDLAEDIFEE